MEKHIWEVEDGSGRSLVVKMSRANGSGASQSRNGEAEILRQSLVWETVKRSS